jgi:hypothetical protein
MRLFHVSRRTTNEAKRSRPRRPLAGRLRPVSRQTRLREQSHKAPAQSASPKRNGLLPQSALRLPDPEPAPGPAYGNQMNPRETLRVVLDPKSVAIIGARGHVSAAGARLREARQAPPTEIK